MKMLPNTDEMDLMAFCVTEQPGRTHKLDIARERINGITDGKEAVMQAVHLLLNVERFAYPIYSHSYGVELADLIGLPPDLAMSEIKRRITEALSQDDRIVGIDQWELDCSKSKVHVSFTVRTRYGDFTAEKEVGI